MRYLMFDAGQGPRLGVLIDQESVVDLAAALPGAPGSVRAVIEAGDPLRDRIAARVAEADCPRLPLASCRLLSPLPNPGKVVCLGLNYANHAKEGGHAVPDYPALFLRTATSLIGPGEPMIVPTCSDRLDYEAELVIVIGKTCRHVREEDALDVIFGYTAFNDGSVRDYQRRTAQWTAGKNFDGTGALGPWIVTADELPPGASGLGIQSRLNGQVMQSSNTENMLFSVPRTIAILTEVMTLEPGDLIATGTPEGVGHARTPPVWMRPGDEIVVEIEGVGMLSNPIQAEAELPRAATG
ncbi:MAG: fumarylacetoacetate hydrolase family protein [Rhodobiaceae bacterium]|nr:fumarylacetoacetate hydrolase family protein [Rhodobiaceae bacterium]